MSTGTSGNPLATSFDDAIIVDETDLVRYLAAIASQENGTGSEGIGALVLPRESGGGSEYWTRVALANMAEAELRNAAQLKRPYIRPEALFGRGPDSLLGFNELPNLVDAAIFGEFTNFEYVPGAGLLTWQQEFDRGEAQTQLAFWGLSFAPLSRLSALRTGRPMAKRIPTLSVAEKRARGFNMGGASVKGSSGRQTTILGENMRERVIPFAENTGARTIPFGVTADDWAAMTPQQRWRLNDGAIRLRINEGDNFRYIGIDPSRPPAVRYRFDLTRSELLRLNDRGVPFETVSPQEVILIIGQP